MGLSHDVREDRPYFDQIDSFDSFTKSTYVFIVKT